MNQIQISILRADHSDAAEILELQKLAFYGQALLYNNFKLHPLVETFEEYEKSFDSFFILKAVCDAQIIGSVRGNINGRTCFITRLIVHPDYQNRGIGSKLMTALEEHFRPQVNRFELFTGHKSERSIHLYTKLGYRIYKNEQDHDVPLCYLEKITNDTSCTSLAFG